MPASTRSLASWRDAHGFGILCIRSGIGERFVITSGTDSQSLLRPVALTELSESAFRERLHAAHLSQSDVDEAVELCRDWPPHSRVLAGCSGIRRRRISLNIDWKACLNAPGH